MVDSTGYALRASVVDDANLSSRWGALILDLCAKQRTSLARLHTLNQGQSYPHTSPVTDVLMRDPLNEAISTSFPTMGISQTWMAFPFDLNQDFGSFDPSVLQ